MNRINRQSTGIALTIFSWVFGCAQDITGEWNGNLHVQNNNIPIVFHIGKGSAGELTAGFFEELSQAQVERQIATNLFGPMNVTRAVLPIMRKNKSGHIISISSTAALVGYELCSAYAAAKFALEGWMESLQIEVASFGIHTTIVEPGFFRTNLLEPSSTIWSELNVEDYSTRIAALKPWWESMSRKQGGDPAKLAVALLKITNEGTPPKRWMAGADSIAEAERKAKELQEQANDHRELSSSLGYD